PGGRQLPPLLDEPVAHGAEVGVRQLAGERRLVGAVARRVDRETDAAQLTHGGPSIPSCSAEPSRHVVGNRPGLERLAGRRRPADPRAYLEAGGAEPGAGPDLVLPPERPGPDPRDLRSDRQHVAVARGALELRSRLDDGHADDVVL